MPPSKRRTCLCGFAVAFSTAAALAGIAATAAARPVEPIPRTSQPKKIASRPRPTADQANRSVADSDFDAPARLRKVLAAVDDSRVRKLVGGKHWAEVVETHREAIEATSDHAAFAAAVNAMLADSGISHFRYFTDDEFLYWYLRSSLEGSRGPAVTHVGLFPQKIDGRWFVRGVLEGSPAVGLDIRVGDELVAYDDQPFAPIDSFRGRAGQAGRLTLRRKARGPTHTVDITPVHEPLSAAVQRAKLSSVAVLEHDGRRLAYLHGWSLMGDAREYAAVLELQDHVDGLLLDYRDGVGGRWESASRFLFGPRSQSGQGRGRAHWHKPVVVLTADGTRSAKEIVVKAVQSRERGLLVGTATPGHVTSVGGLQRIGRDGLLMLPGQPFKQEGHPVEPDIVVERELPYCGGRDPQLQAGVAALAELIADAETSRPSRARRKAS